MSTLEQFIESEKYKGVLIKELTIDDLRIALYEINKSYLFERDMFQRAFDCCVERGGIIVDLFKDQATTAKHSQSHY